MIWNISKLLSRDIKDKNQLLKIFDKIKKLILYMTSNPYKNISTFGLKKVYNFPKK